MSEGRRMRIKSKLFSLPVLTMVAFLFLTSGIVEDTPSVTEAYIALFVAFLLLVIAFRIFFIVSERRKRLKPIHMANGRG